MNNAIKFKPIARTAAFVASAVAVAAGLSLFIADTRNHKSVGWYVSHPGETFKTNDACNFGRASRLDTGLIPMRESNCDRATSAARELGAQGYVRLPFIGNINLAEYMNKVAGEVRDLQAER